MNRDFDQTEADLFELNATCRFCDVPNFYFEFSYYLLFLKFQILKFLLAYKEEKEFPVWLGILNIITTMNGLLSDTSLSENFKSYGQSLISPTAKRLGWELREDESIH